MEQREEMGKTVVIGSLVVIAAVTNLVVSSLGNLENGFINMVFLQMVGLSSSSNIWYF